MVSAKDFKLTYRQKALLAVLKYNRANRRRFFTKRSIVPVYLPEEEWKYVNSMVYGNCTWFKGDTTRKKTNDRSKVHYRELGFNKEIRLIEHASSNHRLYKLYPENIKKYLLATISKKVDFSEIAKVVKHIEEENNIMLRNIGE